ncbi:PTS sugar transporter subunit IIA, partial [Staphylococcus aureus]
MFGFLKKKNEVVENNTMYAVANGTVIPISEVNDPVFSQKMMGDGYAVVPENGEIYAPIEGEVLSVFQTKHAIGLKMTNGLEILLHMGIDTVELN